MGIAAERAHAGGAPAVWSSALALRVLAALFAMRSGLAVA